MSEALEKRFGLKGQVALVTGAGQGIGRKRLFAKQA